MFKTVILPLFLLAGLGLFGACSSDPEPLVTTPPATTGWKPLPVMDLDVRREGERHVLAVRTNTSSAGWTVDLLPYSYSRPPRVMSFKLLGRPPEGPAASVITPHTVELSLDLEDDTRFLQVEGDGAALKASVP